MQSWRLSWLQVFECVNKLLWHEGTSWTPGLPYVGYLVVDEPRGLAVPRLVCHILN